MGTLQQKNSELKAKLDIQTFSVMMIEGEDSATKFYTGLPMWPVFLCLFLFLSPLSSVVKSSPSQFFLVTVKLRLNLMTADLGNRFNISVGLVSRTISKWLEVMYVRLKFLICWPSCDIVQANVLPMHVQVVISKLY